MSEEEKKKLRAKIQERTDVIYNKNFFILPIVTGTLTVLALDYSLEKCYNFPAFILFISLALTTFSVWRYMKLTLEVQDDPLESENKMEEFWKTKYTCFEYFTISTCVLFFGMFVIFCCKIALISKILALV
jgi:hypothetical protein